ncbi:MAG: GDSL-type esterase/lipase family protein [Planctomycetota bacterium]|nr:GDSL-type esterase/lipase family protein [Planctomycetota bacterium]
MKKPWMIGLLLTMFLGNVAFSQTTVPSTGPARVRAGPAPSSTQPSARNRDRHAQFLQIARAGDIDLLFLGDSITDFWRTRGKTVWDKYFAPLKAANFGINSDRTQHLLWRIQNGELEGFKAKCIVLMIGTNNLTMPNQPPRNTVSDAAEGVKTVVREIRARQPDARLLLLGVFPRGNPKIEGGLSADFPGRATVKELNKKIASLDDGQHIFYMDIGDKFLTPDGTLTKEIMADALHPTADGYQIWADAIIDKVKELMK